MNQEKIALIYVHGGPGAGKGTQITKLIDTLPHSGVIYPGGIVLQAQSPEHPLHDTLQQAGVLDVMRQGNIPVNPAVFLQIVISELDTLLRQGVETVFFDGFPRGIAYLPLLDAVQEHVTALGVASEELHAILDVPREERVRRLATRVRIDADEERKQQARQDAHEAVVEPMIAAIRQTRRHVVIDGTNSEDNVQTTLSAAVHELLSSR